jgi:hypothetical protein
MNTVPSVAACFARTSVMVVEDMSDPRRIVE